ncbi:hypothetical protein RB2150_09039 [Rhodobacterales bacterium HTCC2150]|nr:hypothetical protein RB2150_09039 [Rhodobacterales bacterium HTCC2150] [Rhodobacteraceae bacterium HTCC2150]
MRTSQSEIRFHIYRASLRARRLNNRPPGCQVWPSHQPKPLGKLK